MAFNKLPFEYYQNPNVVFVAKNLIGKYLFTQINGELTGGIITETEAYSHINDKACHSYNNRYTQRTKTMYKAGGVAYVYLCYGIHYLFNIVTNVNGKADAVLIRAIQPTAGVNFMLERRNKSHITKQLTSGPGCVSKALGINKLQNGIELLGDEIFISSSDENGKNENPLKNTPIIATTRIGVEYAKEDALLPWRFYPKGSEWVSKK